MFVNGNDYLALPRDPVPWLVKDLVPTSGIVNLYGKPKLGKSFAALGLALAIANGEEEWNGFPVMKQGRVAYFQIDTPRGEWAARLANIRQTNSALLANIYFMDMVMTPFYPFDILNPEHFQYLRKALDAIDPVLSILDTTRELHTADENDSTQMRNVYGKLVAATQPSALLTLSHARKDSMMSKLGGDDIMDDMRGSSYVSGRVDSMIRLTATTLSYKGRGAGSGSIGVEQDKATGLIVRKEDDVRIEELVRTVIATAPIGTSVRQLGALVQQAAKDGELKRTISEKTSRRWVEKVMKPK